MGLVLNPSHKMQYRCVAEVIRSDGTVRDRRVIAPQDRAVDTLELIVRNPYGEVVDYHKMPVQSWVENWNEIQYGRMASVNQTLQKTDASTYSKAPVVASVYAHESDGNFGILLGRDDGSSYALAITNYKLGTAIAQGSSTNQLLYSDTYFIDTALDGTDAVFKVWRTMTNESGATVTVKEAGLVTYETAYVMAIRDLNDSTGTPILVALANNYTMEGRYTFTISQSSGLTLNWMLQHQALLQHDVGVGEAGIDITDTDGDTVEIEDEPQHTVECDCANTVDAYGVVVGTGSAALDIEDYALGTQVAHGESSTQLYYGTTEWAAPSVSGNDSEFSVRRTFSNHSGGTINLEEAGIYGRGRGASKRMLFLRTLLNTITVLDTESVRINYTFLHKNQ